MPKIKGKIINCPHTDRPVWAKGMCQLCYAKQYSQRLDVKKRKAVYRKKRYWSDSEYREKEKAKGRFYARKWAEKHYKENPDFYRNKNKEYREKDPVKFRFVMAKSYAKSLTYEQKGILIDFIVRERIREKEKHDTKNKENIL